jgi:glycosyltransferase involved in cell wall biosynthesis
MQEVTVVIICENEERTIEKVINAAKKVSSDIVIVDSGSTDNTVEIARSLGAECHHQKWLGFGPQKNFAISLAKSNWILSLDADEIVDSTLTKEIKEALARQDLKEYDGFRVPRLLIIGGKEIIHGGFFPDAQLRLFDRTKGQFNERKVHEAVHVKGKVAMLKGKLLHHAYPDFDAYKLALDKYAKLSAEEFSTRGDSAWRTSKLNEWIHPIWTFFYRYILRLGFLDGKDGLQAALIYSDYVRKKIAYLRDLKRSK